MSHVCMSECNRSENTVRWNALGVKRNVELTLKSPFREERKVGQECTTELSVGIDPCG